MPGPGISRLVVSPLADLLNVLQRLFSCLDIEYVPLAFKFYCSVLYWPGPGFVFKLNTYFTGFIMYPGQLDILESTYLPEVFKEETEWY